MLYDKKWDREVKVVDEIGQIMLNMADYIEKHGHTKNRLHDDRTGAVCLRGAFICLRGYVEYTICSQIEERMGFDLLSNEAVDWNNAPERTGEEVIARLRACACP